MEPKPFYSPEYRWITVRTSDGSTMRGKMNIGATERISDLFVRGDLAFVVMVEVAGEGGKATTRFVNKDHIIWVEPDETPPAETPSVEEKTP